MKSPTILLLCKMIKNECIHILRSRPFIIDQIPPWLPGALRPMKLLGFVGRQTLRNLRYIDIRIALGEGIGSGWVWKDILQEIFDALHDESHFVTMRIMIKRCNVSNASLWDFEEQNKYLQIKDMIACFEKAAPNVWTPGQVIVEDWVVQGRRARRVMSHVPEDGRLSMNAPGGNVADICAEQEMYYYPNRDIWPGSMLEFVQPSDPVQRRPSIGN
ncbi:hypothetical protein UCRPA7_1373 [Phaeoacremonium minimum UCRPA7]|uniref:Uncharacterized protein n=1 Tax=Phaeoacremonium minimum (strain UCR-PA7) TaxID=1286976 RepID=R8BUU3_PHAM7|nr:hypothetical protein UCRPA7_1373 [Phaeoacremonium minimum UCRPA7]EOO03141.1 hypothetical protein UCRPA7_1373 [Phaeoacremonium minimum UCRPA7]